MYPHTDPLAPVSSRFPLGPPAEHWSSCHEEPSEVGTRPFSLRGVVPVPSTIDQVARITYTYDPVRQIGLARDADGVVVPLAKHTRPGATPAATSGSTDGDPDNPPPEEMGNPDYQTD